MVNKFKIIIIQVQLLFQISKKAGTEKVTRKTMGGGNFEKKKI